MSFKAKRDVWKQTYIKMKSDKVDKEHLHLCSYITKLLKLKNIQMVLLLLSYSVSYISIDVASFEQQFI